MLRLSDLNKTKMETFHSNVLFLLVKRAATTSRKIQCMPWRPFKKKSVHLRRSSSNFIHEKQGSLGTISLTNSLKFATPREMRSEEWAQKFPTDDVHYPNMGSATDWLKQISLATRPRTESATSQWNQWWRCHEISGVFLRLGYHGQIWAVVALNSFLYLRNLFGHTLCAWKLMEVAS